jgi:general secretion pathway protein G
MRFRSRTCLWGGCSRHRAFTFLEIMLVVVIIGILVAVIGPRLAGRSERAMVAATKQQVSGVKTALSLYEMQVGDFPTTEQGLDALVVRPTDVDEERWTKCMDEVPQDAWKQSFLYRSPGEHGDYDLVSTGKDKREGTDDDIVSYSSKSESTDKKAL